jgi:glycosyltransferase involved in cell wall biosynthesis
VVGDPTQTVKPDGARDDVLAVTRISVIVPAHDEQRWISACLDAIASAGRSIQTSPEVVVVTNRCSDQTAAIAEQCGARVVENDARAMASVRNAGAAVASGDILVSIDADRRMSPRALGDVERHLATGRVVGGSAAVIPERRSVGISLTHAVVRAGERVSGLGNGMLWCRADDFHAIDGFNDRLLMAEDLDFARRLREHGRPTGRRFVHLRKAPVVASCRSFDSFGDWHAFGLIRHAGEVKASLEGRDRTFADRYLYDAPR